MDTVLLELIERLGTAVAVAVVLDMDQMAHRGTEVGKGVFSEPGRIVCGRFAQDYQRDARLERGFNLVVGARKVIVEKFRNFFRNKTEESMQERAKDSRIKKEVEDATDEFNETTRDMSKLTAVFKDLKDKAGHG